MSLPLTSPTAVALTTSRRPTVPFLSLTALRQQTTSPPPSTSAWPRVFLQSSARPCVVLAARLVIQYPLLLPHCRPSSYLLASA
ncbi:hypothetical protein NL676_008231 [Syzygium grande]|nr:hypothetical protein NL676_008231 [Syzygium grande]